MLGGRHTSHVSKGIPMKNLQITTFTINFFIDSPSQQSTIQEYLSQKMRNLRMNVNS